MHRPRLMLYAEGKTDREFFRRICVHHEIEGVTFFLPKREPEGGKGWLKQELHELLKDQRAERFGLILDSDASLKAEWQSVRDVASKIDLPSVDTADLPKEYPPDGYVRGNFGVWLIAPTADFPGDLEAFKLQLVADDVMGRAKAAVAREADLLTKVSKATMGTWLAWQRNGAGMMEAEAWNEGLLQMDRSIAGGFVAWVRRMLASPAE